MMDYYNEVHGFINYALFNPRNISGGGIRCLCKRYKNKKNFDPNVVTMHIFYKNSSWKIHMLVCKKRTISSSRYHGRKDGWVNF
jgi:hypothetical protein